ncbi:HAD family hydrolase, partial [Staphylococcus xylosus]|uniref:HAD family hydrolase n=1 Tax=Staphylococcus xylosus TaxID=1288 RepID=UPI001C599A3B
TLYTLEKLTNSGYLTGVIANGKSKIKQYRMHALGVEDAINYLSTSETVGYRKPHPKIFEDMLDQLGTKPEETMYVGDDPLNDVAPARAMGMVSVWFKEEQTVDVEPLPEEVDFTINTTEELLSILPIGKKGR